MVADYTLRIKLDSSTDNNITFHSGLIVTPQQRVWGTSMIFFNGQRKTNTNVGYGVMRRKENQLEVQYPLSIIHRYIPVGKLHDFWLQVNAIIGEDRNTKNFCMDRTPRRKLTF